MSDLVIKEEILPHIKGSLFSNFTNANEAIAEIVDNSVAHRIAGSKLIIKILIIPQSKKIEVIDRGGEGMSLLALEDFFRWGMQKSRSSYDIGKYGQGGKAAIGYLGKAFQLSTSAKGENKAYTIEDNDIHDVALKEYTVIENETSPENAYTRVIINKVVHPLTQNFKAKLSDTLAKNYRPLLRKGAIEIFLDTEKINPTVYPLDPNYKEEQFSFEVNDHRYSTLVKGWVGRQVGGRSGVKGGMRLYYKGRLISEKEFFSHPDPTKKQTLNYLIGEVFIEDVIHPNMNKTDFNKSTDAWRMFQNKMDEILQPHIDELYGRTVDEPTEDELNNMRKVKELANEALKLMKENKLWTGEGINSTEGIKQPTPSEKQEIPKMKNQTTRHNTARTPSPPDSVGKRKRLKNFIDWEIRNMGESIRSVIEERSKNSVKTRVLVINKDFPGYLRTKGNEFYLFETFALQMVPIDSDEMPYIKYLEEFDRFFGNLCSFIDEAKTNITKRKD